MRMLLHIRTSSLDLKLSFTENELFSSERNSTGRLSLSLSLEGVNSEKWKLIVLNLLVQGRKKLS